MQPIPIAKPILDEEVLLNAIARLLKKGPLA